MFSQIAVAADTQLINKGDYSILNPVPDEQLRPLSSSAADGVLDARTLDVGHVQVEGALLDYYYDARRPFYFYSGFNEFVWTPRISVGLLNNVDFFIRPSYHIEENPYYYRNANEFGRVNTGVKVNLWGNDDGMTALAIQPYLSIPTQEDDGKKVLAGGDVAFLVRLPWDFSVKFDSEIYQIKYYTDTSYAGFNEAASIHKSFCSRADAYGYFEVNKTTVPYDNAWVGYTGLGVDYNFTRNLQMFAGFGFGVNSFRRSWTDPRAADYNPRVGGVWRF